MGETPLTSEEFLKIASEFQLGALLTEGHHPLTKGLAELVHTNLSQAIISFRNVDIEMLKVLKDKVDEIEDLKKNINSVFSKGGRIFLCGCGATGRLSLTLETLWRQANPGSEEVLAFMAGGDLALIHSIEKFEDYPEYGKKQLLDLGFKKGDLLLASSEGGETPWVIGACEAAAELGGEKPYFLYCNPDDALKKVALRSKEIIENGNVKKVNLTHGPQALSGSTRLQASTILEAFIGFALFPSPLSLLKRVETFIDWYKKSSFDFLKDFIIEETNLYKNDEFLYYVPQENLGITVLTDTTERSPTFSLQAFENIQDKKPNPSLCYLLFKDVETSREGWIHLLGRAPRALAWDEVIDIAGEERLWGFNFSQEILAFRSKWIKDNLNYFKIFTDEGEIVFELKNITSRINVSQLEPLSLHLALKCMLNLHSTLVMGKLNRYQSNIMTWVRPSNNKLIDRTVRYAQQLLKENGREVSYEDLVCCLYKQKDLTINQSLVLKLVSLFSSE
jgi:N-acetylmuramic acid 6-phosphate etherase